MEAFTPAFHVREAEDTIQLPAWSIAAESWYGQPRLRAFAEIGNVVPFSLEPPREAFGSNVMVCVAFRTGTTWTRYTLWDSPLFPHLETYQGERLGVGARLEYWTINALAPSVPEGVVLGIGRLTNQEWRCSLKSGGNVFLGLDNNSSAYDEPCSPFFPA